MRTEDDYRDSDLTPDRLRAITIKLAEIDPETCRSILARFGVLNLSSLRFAQLRDYYEAVWAALEGGASPTHAAPTQEEWEEHARRHPNIHKRVHDQLVRSRYAKVRGSAI